MQKKKNWYVAVLVVSSEIPGTKNYKSLVDLQFRIINSNDPEEAYKSAIRIGKNEEHSYKNSEAKRYVGASVV